jgi:hypothetical protein
MTRLMRFTLRGVAGMFPLRQFLELETAEAILPTLRTRI